MFRKILIANRGEIAVRVIRTCREMGIATIAVHSEPDRASLPVRLADQAVSIGEATPSESYLNMDKLIAAARETCADAVHPGYGFLSENAEFADKCIEAGIAFIGPEPSVLRSVGDKEAARRAMKGAGVPVIPGSEAALKDVDEAIALAGETGYPIVLKAVSGGGGRGIRAVRSEDELKSAFPRASAEAMKAFGDGSLYLEKQILNARHIEVQVLADNRGNVVALGERACSVQRRHQKLIEETPSPDIPEETREELARHARAGMKAVGYTTAGTVEFLVDHDNRIYFLEVNARIQVEHTVSEMVTGLDLVGWQIRTAAGEELGREVLEASPVGHAIEARICAEDPEKNFAPCTGRIRTIFMPGGRDVRVDTALCVGDTVGISYDSLVAKISARGVTRESAIRNLMQALRELRIGGIITTRAFLYFVLQRKEFIDGTYDTSILADDTETDLAETDRQRLGAMAIGAAIVEHCKRRGGPSAADPGDRPDDDIWKRTARAEGVSRMPGRGW